MHFDIYQSEVHDQFFPGSLIELLDWFMLPLKSDQALLS